MRVVRIATRRSALARAQTETVARLLRDAHPDVEVELVEVETRGDQDQASPIAELTEVGAFVRAVQEAVLDGRADLAVHSLKDLPVSGVEGLELAAIPERVSPFDVMVGSPLDDLAPGSRVGTGSPRRAEQLLMLRPDVEPTELRGNVETRLRKVGTGEVAAAVLARAGLERLGLSGSIEEEFGLDRMLPAPGQGALAVEAAADGPAAELARSIDDPAQRPLVDAERSLMALTGAGCRAALGALATWDGGEIRLEAFVSDSRGRRRGLAVGDTPGRAADRARVELGL